MRNNPCICFLLCPGRDPRGAPSLTKSRVGFHEFPAREQPRMAAKRRPARRAVARRRSRCGWLARSGPRAPAYAVPIPLRSSPAPAPRCRSIAGPSKVIPRWAAKTLVSFATTSGWRAPQFSLIFFPLGVTWVRWSDAEGGKDRVPVQSVPYHHSRRSAPCAANTGGTYPFEEFSGSSVMATVAEATNLGQELRTLASRRRH